MNRVDQSYLARRNDILQALLFNLKEKLSLISKCSDDTEIQDIARAGIELINFRESK